ncbi:MAG TPA: histidine kinase, partial [Naasia sp.]
YSLGAWGRNRRASTLLRGAIIAGMLLWLFLDLGIRFANPELLLEYSPQSSVQSAVAIAIINVFVNLLYFGAAYVFGERAWTSARERAALQARTAELAEERERSARQAVVLERLRIARELHDVVAHHVSVMGVQAGAARRVLPSAPERAVEALSAVEESARRAVDDLQRMLGTLRSDGQEEESAPSTLGVDGIPALVEEARKAGRTATLSAFGEPRDVGGTVGNTLYRVAQEAITNSIKHAAPTSALDVRLRWLPGTVELEVSDTGGRPVTPARGAGLGLVGMRERLNAVGGTLDSGPRREGGYLVRAAVPTDEPAGVLPATGSGGPAAAETPADAVRVGAAR